MVTSAELLGMIRFALRATESNWPVSRARSAMVELGEELGHDATRIFTSNNLVDLAVEFSSFWTAGGLGNMKVVSKNPLYLEAKNCHDCISWKLDPQTSSCNFKIAFMKTIFEDVLGKTIRVQETQCCRHQAPACVFSVRGGNSSD